MCFEEGMTLFTALVSKSQSPSTPHPGVTARPRGAGSRRLLLPPSRVACVIQPKLEVDAISDPLEHEADRAADHVTRRPAAASPSSPGRAISRLSANDRTSGLQEVLRSPGNSLDLSTRGYFERRFGYDFSAVRIHTGGAAAHSARNVNARAYTVGHDVVFGAGQFAPDTSGGRHLLAHELAHVVQQSRPDGRRAPLRVARAPGPAVRVQEIHPAAMEFLVGKLRSFFELLSPAARIRLKRNLTIAIGMATVDNEPRLVYTVAGNATSPEIRAAAEELDLHRWTYTSGVKGRGAVGAPNDAEQLMTEFATDNDAELHGMAVSRRVCPDCGEVIPEHGHGQVKVTVVEDPIEVPRRGTPKGPAGGPTSAGPQAGGAEARAAGAEAETAEAEARAAGVEAEVLRGEGAAAEVARGAAKAGRLARLGGLLLELGLPGPADVFEMFLIAFASIAEAKAALKADAYALGFSEGLAASLTGTSSVDTIYLLMYKVVAPSIGERVAGFAGARERGNNEGVAAGFRFGNALRPAQRHGFREKCFADIKAGGLPFTGDFGRDDLITMGVALKPTVVKLLDEAARQEAEKEEHERRMNKDWYGHNV